MKIGFFIFFTLHLILSCNAEKNEPRNPRKDELGQLLNQDSITCWATQVTNFYEPTTYKYELSETVYSGLHFATKDSIYSFSYPCEYRYSRAFQFYGDSLIIGKENMGKFSRTDPFLFLVIEKYDWYDTTHLIIEETAYKRFNIASKELSILLKEKYHPNCDTNKRDTYMGDFEMKMFDINHGDEELYGRLRKD